MDAGSPIINTVTADFAETTPHNASGSVDIHQSPDFTVAKVADVSSVSAAGQVIHYTITVHNTGNITLSNPVISDPLRSKESRVGNDCRAIGKPDDDEN